MTGINRRTAPDRIESDLLASGLRRGGSVLEAVVQIVESRPMWEQGERAMGKAPFFFVERK
jgi:hypothetical protein